MSQQNIISINAKNKKVETETHTELIFLIEQRRPCSQKFKREFWFETLCFLSPLEKSGQDCTGASNPELNE